MKLIAVIGVCLHLICHPPTADAETDRSNVVPSSSKNCGEILSPLSFSWSSPKTFMNRNLPLKDLMINGVAHLPLPKKYLRVFSTFDGSRGLGLDDSLMNARIIAERSRLADELGDLLFKKLRSTFKDLDFCFPSRTGSVAFNVMKSLTSEKQEGDEDFQWHFDAQDLSGGSELLDYLAADDKRHFNLRATLVAPIDIFPPTPVFPGRGPRQGTAVQGTGGVISVMILETSEHSVDYRYGAQGRSLIGWDCRVKMKPTQSK